MGLWENDHMPLAFLMARGWKCHRNGMLWPPHPINSKWPDDEVEAATYLCQEWDFCLDSELQGSAPTLPPQAEEPQDVTSDLVKAIACSIAQSRGRVYAGPDELKTAERALSAIKESGFAIVPKEPTAAMVRAGILEKRHSIFCIYDAMIAAGPCADKGDA